MIDTIKIAGKKIGKNRPTFIIAEMSGNHNMDYDRAVEIIKAAKYAGVDAIKLQTYTADTITLNSNKECFWTDKSSLWAGMTLHELYEQAYTPWEWQPKLKQLADELGIILFSSPFDGTAVDFLEEMNVPAYKIASYEINDIPLIRKTAETGKPILISTGIAELADIELAVRTCREAGNEQIILLKCTSEYPAPYEGMNLRMIPNLAETFECVSGLSDHSLGDEIALSAVALGANVIEKHFTLSRADGGVDSAFSMEVEEMKTMVERIRHVEMALGKVTYQLTEKQVEAKKGSRSLFVAIPIKKGEIFTEKNVRSVRPGIGIPTKYLDEILGKCAAKDLDYAEPLQYGDIEWEGENKKGSLQL